MEEECTVRVAVIGCGWWAQGWHLPHLVQNGPHVVVAALVDASAEPLSTLSSSPLLSLVELSKTYKCPHYKSVEELLADPEVCPTLDGAIVATSHASHYAVGMALLNEGIRRREQAVPISNGSAWSGSHHNCCEGVEIKGSCGGAEIVHRALHIMMEKPMTTSVREAHDLCRMSISEYPEGAFIINHTANYRQQTFVAQDIISSGKLGKIRHITATMNGGLMWLFDDPKNHSWVSRTPWNNASGGDDGNKTETLPMTGNGYGWGQLAHVLAWIYAVLGPNEVAVPTSVYCNMGHAPNTGADISLSAVITCSDGITFSVSGTALLPGSQYADPPVGKRINIEIFGMDGALLYGGDDRIPESGRLELRRSAPGKKEDGQAEYPCSDILKDGFYFEDGDQEGKGPGSMRVFLDACKSSVTRYRHSMASEENSAVSAETLVNQNGSSTLANDSLIGLRTVQIIDAMYKSSLSGTAVDIQ